MRLDWFKWKTPGQGRKKRKRKDVVEIPERVETHFQDEPIYEEIDFNFTTPRLTSVTDPFSLERSKFGIDRFTPLPRHSEPATECVRHSEPAAEYARMSKVSTEESSNFYFPMGPTKAGAGKFEKEHKYYTIEAHKSSDIPRKEPTILPELDHRQRNVFGRSHTGNTYVFEACTDSSATEKPCLPEGCLELCIDDLFLRKYRHGFTPSERNFGDVIAFDHVPDFDHGNGFILEGSAKSWKSADEKVHVFDDDDNNIRHDNKKSKYNLSKIASGLSFKSESGYGSSISGDNGIYTNIDSEDDGYVYGDAFSSTQEANSASNEISNIGDGDHPFYAVKDIVPLKSPNRKDFRLQKSESYQLNKKNSAIDAGNPVHARREFLENRGISLQPAVQPSKNANDGLRESIAAKKHHSLIVRGDSSFLEARDKLTLVDSETWRYAPRGARSSGNFTFHRSASHTALNDLIWSNFNRRC